jgi:hypothetical protein
MANTGKTHEGQLQKKRGMNVVQVLRPSVVAKFYSTKRLKSLRGVLGYPHGIGIKGAGASKSYTKGANFSV